MNDIDRLDQICYSSNHRGSNRLPSYCKARPLTIHQMFSRCGLRPHTLGRMITAGLGCNLKVIPVEVSLRNEVW